MSLVLAVAALTACSPAGTAHPDFSWLSGTWRTVHQQGYSEVTFGPQHENRLSGVLRVVSNNETLLLEIISLEAANKTAVLRVRHLTAQLEPREAAPLVFELTQTCRRGAVFTNTAGSEASPQRSTYYIDDAGKLKVVIEGIRSDNRLSRTYSSTLGRVE